MTEKKTPLMVRCKACGYAWPVAWLPMLASLFFKVTRRICCPNCGNGPKGIFLAGDVPDRPTDSP